MSDDNKIRLAHELLDEVNAREDLTPEQVGVLRSFLPERPKRKTLEDVYREVCNAWYRTDGDVWKVYAFGELEDWLRELHEQLKGLIDAQSTAPALPEGMCLADHEEYGRVVVSPKPNNIGEYKIFRLDNNFVSGSGFGHAKPDELTPIDAEPAEPVHPEFLETEDDYEQAPVGTIVAATGARPWVKLNDGTWLLGGGIDERASILEMNTGSRRVLRWGTGES